jgi:hypothetical protein
MTMKSNITATKMTGYKDIQCQITKGNFEDTIGQMRFKWSTSGSVPVVITKWQYFCCSFNSDLNGIFLIANCILQPYNCHTSLEFWYLKLSEFFLQYKITNLIGGGGCELYKFHLYYIVHITVIVLQNSQKIFKLHSQAKIQVQSCDNMPIAGISNTVWVWNTGWLITAREEVFALSGNLLLSQSSTTNLTWIIVGLEPECPLSKNIWAVA